MNTINLVTNINQLMNRGETVIKKLRDTGVQEINAKSLKGVSGFNKGDMAPLLVEFYEITKRAMEIIPALQALEKQAITKLDKLEDKVFADGLPEALNLANVRRVIKEELKEAVPSITKDAKEETKKKWSDVFTKN
jgi:formate dehydrogenase maturation protein FdhE